MKKSYTSKQNLEVHVKYVHEIFKLNCLYCNSIFKSKSAFKKHHISKHTARSDTKIVVGRNLDHENTLKSEKNDTNK